MEKASLKKVSEEFIEHGGKKQKNIKLRTHKKTHNTKKRINAKMIRQTLFLPEEINKTLWHHRVNTGKSISKIVTELVSKYIKND